MKIRLLLFALFFVSVAAVAQFNVSENFNSVSGIPTTWTSTNFFIHTGTENCDGTQVPKTTLSGAASISHLISPSYVSDGNQINVGIKYRRIAATSFSGLVSIAYEINNSNSWIPLFTDSFFDSTCRDLTGFISPNIVAAGATIRFRFSAIRYGGQADVFFDNFTAVQSAPSLLTEYTFNNTNRNTQGNHPFNSAGAITYTNDRNNNPSGAVTINTIGGLQGSIPLSLLPSGNSRRTISLWFKITGNLPSAAAIFTYGSNNNGKRFGAYLANTSNLFFQSSGNDTNLGGTYSSNDWWHIVFSYDRTNIKAYINGTLIGTYPYSLDTTFTDLFLAGTVIAPTIIDDIKIFDGPLTNEQVSSLYTNNSLSASDFVPNNLKAALYPNPVKDFLNIETANEIKSVEIYNLLGQKVKTATTKQVNVFDLNKGVYMVKVIDENNAEQTMKFVKQ